jgi:hypothetical protein
MSPNADKGPTWVVDLLPKDGNPDSPERRFMDLQFSDDLSSVTISRMGPNGEVQTFEMRYDGPADLARLFHSESLAMVTVQANQNYAAQGLGTSMAAPVTFSPEGHVVCEIHRAGKSYRKVIFDPEKLQLTIRDEGDSILIDKRITDPASVTVEAARVLGVKLPLAKQRP